MPLDGLVTLREELASIPPAPPSRAFVEQRVARARSSEELVLAFVLAMAWGSRRKSYGPYRVSVMLAGDRNQRPIGEVLAGARAEVFQSDSDSHVDNAVAGYRVMARKIEMCGPAFATKFLYFASPRETRAPILDGVVAAWLRRHDVTTAVGRPISATSWSEGEYRSYVEFCRSVASDLGVLDLGFLEYLMFMDQRRFDYVRLGRSIPKWLLALGDPEQDAD